MAESRRFVATVVAAILLALPVAVPAAGTAGTADDIAAGQAFYTDGHPGVAARLFGRSLPSIRFACRRCHGRSAEGGREGATRAPPLDWPALTRATSGRPAYDLASLRRLLVDGQGLSGQGIDPAMPRYDLDDERLRQLVAFLQALPALERRGVTADAVVFGVLSLPGSRAQAEGFAQGLARRLAEAGPIYQRRLEVRVLEIAAETRTAIDTALDSSPVLAIVGLARLVPGLLEAAARGGTPLLFPMVPIPVEADRGLVRGLAADETVLARALADRIASDGFRSVGVLAGEAGPSDTLLAALAERGLAIETPTASSREGNDEENEEVGREDNEVRNEVSNEAGRGGRAILVMRPGQGARDRLLATAPSAVYGFAGELATHVPALDHAGIVSVLAVEQTPVIRLAVAWQTSVAEAQAEISARVIEAALSAAGRDLGRGRLLAALDKQRLRIEDEIFDFRAAPAAGNTDIHWLVSEPRASRQRLKSCHSDISSATRPLRYSAPSLP